MNERENEIKDCKINLIQEGQLTLFSDKFLISKIIFDDELQNVYFFRSIVHFPEETMNEQQSNSKNTKRQDNRTSDLHS